MSQHIWRPALIGIAIGALCYFAPFFFFPGFFIFLAIGGLFRFLFFRRYGYGFGWRHRHHDAAFADAIRSMSPEEYEKFRSRNYYESDRFRNDRNADDLRK